MQKLKISKDLKAFLAVVASVLLVLAALFIGLSFNENKIEAEAESNYVSSIRVYAKGMEYNLPESEYPKGDLPESILGNYPNGYLTAEWDSEKNRYNCWVPAEATTVDVYVDVTGNYKAVFSNNKFDHEGPNSEPCAAFDLLPAKGTTYTFDIKQASGVNNAEEGIKLYIGHGYSLCPDLPEPSGSLTFIANKTNLEPGDEVTLTMHATPVAGHDMYTFEYFLYYDADIFSYAGSRPVDKYKDMFVKDSTVTDNVSEEYSNYRYLRCMLTNIVEENDNTGDWNDELGIYEGGDLFYEEDDYYYITFKVREDCTYKGSTTFEVDKDDTSHSYMCDYDLLNCSADPREYTMAYFEQGEWQDIELGVLGFNFPTLTIKSGQKSSVSTLYGDNIDNNYVANNDKISGITVLDPSNNQYKTFTKWEKKNGDVREGTPSFYFSNFEDKTVNVRLRIPKQNYYNEPEVQTIVAQKKDNSYTDPLTIVTEEDGFYAYLEINFDDLKEISSIEFQNRLRSQYIIPITVTSEDGSSSTTYELHLYRAKPDATLGVIETLKVDGVNATALAGETNAYEITVPYSAKTISITAVATLESHLAKAELAGVSEPFTANASYVISVPVVVGENNITITLNSQDDNKSATYTLKVNRTAAETEGGISSISLSNGSLSVTTALSETEERVYIATQSVPYAQRSGWNISAVSTGQFAQIAYSAANKTLTLGENVFTVTVTPEAHDCDPDNNQPIEYTVKVTLIISEDSDVSVTAVSGEEPIALNRVGVNFTAPTELSITKKNIALTVTPTASTSSVEVRFGGEPVSISGGVYNLTLVGGSNVITVTVYSESYIEGNKENAEEGIDASKYTEYKVTITVVDDDTDFTLKAKPVVYHDVDKPYTVTESISGGKTEYKVSYPENLEQIYVSVEATDASNQVKIWATGANGLSDALTHEYNVEDAIAINSSVKKLIIVLTAESGVTESYTIVLEPYKVSEDPADEGNPNLSALELKADGESVNIRREVEDLYFAEISSSNKKLILTVVTENANATVAISAERADGSSVSKPVSGVEFDLTDDMFKLVVEVKHLGETRVYTVVLVRPEFVPDTGLAEDPTIDVIDGDNGDVSITKLNDTTYGVELKSRVSKIKLGVAAKAAAEGAEVTVYGIKKDGTIVAIPNLARAASDYEIEISDELQTINILVVNDEKSTVYTMIISVTACDTTLSADPDISAANGNGVIVVNKLDGNTYDLEVKTNVTKLNFNVESTDGVATVIIYGVKADETRVAYSGSELDIDGVQKLLVEVSNGNEVTVYTVNVIRVASNTALAGLPTITANDKEIEVVQVSESNIYGITKNAGNKITLGVAAEAAEEGATVTVKKIYKANKNADEELIDVTDLNDIDVKNVSSLLVYVTNGTDVTEYTIMLDGGIGGGFGSNPGVLAAMIIFIILFVAVVVLLVLEVLHIIDMKKVCVTTGTAVKKGCVKGYAAVKKGCVKGYNALKESFKKYPEEGEEQQGEAVAEAAAADATTAEGSSGEGEKPVKEEENNKDSDKDKKEEKSDSKKDKKDKKDNKKESKKEEKPEPKKEEKSAPEKDKKAGENKNGKPEEKVEAKPDEKAEAKSENQSEQKPADQKAKNANYYNKNNHYNKNKNKKHR